jgi:exodeoxyribonuclease V gamma subunit
MDTLERFGFRDHTIQHSLQPFASVDCKERTYDHSAVRAAEALGSPAPVARFVDAELPGPAGNVAAERIDLADLQAFWKSPAAWFCRHAADLAMAWEREEAEAESLVLNDLQKWQVRDAALRDPEWLEDDRRLRARHALPLNPLVERELHDIRSSWTGFAEAAFPPADLIAHSIEVEGSDFVVTGELRRLPEGPMVGLVAGSLKPGSRVQLLVAHALAGCAGLPGPSRVGSIKQAGRLESWDHFEDPLAVLTELVAGYRRGRTTPLHFFPRTSFAFAKARAKLDLDPQAIFATPSVQQAWSHAPDGSRTFVDAGEVHDEAVALCVRGLEDVDVCNAEFVYWAETFAEWFEAIGGKL